MRLNLCSWEEVNWSAHTSQHPSTSNSSPAKPASAEQHPEELCFIWSWVHSVACKKLWLNKKHFPLTSTECFSPGPGFCAVFSIVWCKKKAAAHDTSPVQSRVPWCHLAEWSASWRIHARLQWPLHLSKLLQPSWPANTHSLPSACWAVSSHHWLSWLWQVRGALDDGDTGRNQLWWHICWEDIGTSPLKTDNTQSMCCRLGFFITICFGGSEIQKEPYCTNALFGGSPTLLLTHIFIKISYYQAFLNSTPKVLWILVSEHPSPSNTCFWALLESPLIPNSLTLLADAVKELGSDGGICSVMLGLDSRLEWLAKGSSFLSTILNKKRNQMFQYCTSKALLYTECGLHSGSVLGDLSLRGSQRCQCLLHCQMSGLSARSFPFPKESDGYVCQAKLLNLILTDKQNLCRKHHKEDTQVFCFSQFCFLSGNFFPGKSWDKKGHMLLLL